MDEPKDGPSATDADVSAALSEVLRLTTALADQVRAELIAGRTIGRDQSDALSTAVSGLRRQGVILPPALERTIHDISRRATAVIARADRPTVGALSWTFGRMRGRQRLILSARKTRDV
ncbi:hypothetical protein [Methylobacterium longum]|uniref:Uncharacterized protein n=1 Tax=Methylobacterium longum TaxID=767694 RepID=A0ABT8AT03_9HYPH|nr:hypothetical protein [Methylobacterium longum]MDN3572555.1 hypothetical protein [Methylobacterium longum]GJE12629.1 hypothetical protein FOHLNKBM_3679 [Methylobacterium longum]